MLPDREIKGKRRTLALLAFLLLFSFALMTATAKKGESLTWPESLALLLIQPIQTVITDGVDAISNMFDHYFFLVGVSIENESLNKKIDRLTWEKNQLLEKIKKNERIDKLISFSDSNNYKTQLANVIGRDASQWSKMVFIDKGSRDGIREKMAVVTDQGIIGHIIQAGPVSSKVLLITDSRSSVDAIFQKLRDPGVVAGAGSKLCDMKYVPLTSEVKVDDIVISSGLGGIFPKGLIVGKVAKVTHSKQDLFKSISLVPAADLVRLEEVMVLLP